MNMDISKVDERYDDSCEKCESEEKPLYRIVDYDFAIDMILCPKCIKTFKERVSRID